MFSNIQTMFFGKAKHHNHAADDSGIDKGSGVENDYVFVERRHSSQPGPPGPMYPNLELPSPSALPYGVSPSLPNLAQPIAYDRNQKQGSNIVLDNKDMLSGVPFTLSSQFNSLNDTSDYVLSTLLHKKDEVSEDSVLKFFDYNFQLENRILKEMESYKP